MFQVSEFLISSQTKIDHLRYWLPLLPTKVKLLSFATPVRSSGWGYKWKNEWKSLHICSGNILHIIDVEEQNSIFASCDKIVFSEMVSNFSTSKADTRSVDRNFSERVLSFLYNGFLHWFLQQKKKKFQIKKTWLPSFSSFKGFWKNRVNNKLKALDTLQSYG